jgi:hypothetical protein
LPAKEIHETDYSAQEGPAKESFTSIAPDPIDDGDRQRNIECAAVSDNKEELINDRCMAGETIDGAKERFVPTHVDDDKASPVIRQPSNDLPLSTRRMTNDY